MKLINKWNGKNFYLIKDWKYIDVVKVKGYFYVLKFSEKFWEATAVWNPIKVK